MCLNVAGIEVHVVIAEESAVSLCGGLSSHNWTRDAVCPLSDGLSSRQGRHVPSRECSTG